MSTNEELVIKIKAGGDTADNMLRLYDQVKAFIHTIAWKYRAYGELEDLEQEGYLALYDAVDGYDPATGSKFITYAGFWIKQRIQQYVFTCCQGIHITGRAQMNVQRYRKFCTSFQQEHNRNPTDQEGADYMGVTLQQVQQIRKDAQIMDVGSLDECLPGLEGEGISLVDTIAADTDIEADTLDYIQYEQLKAALWGCVDGLKGQQPEIIRERYAKNRTLAETGERCGLPPGRIHLLEKEGLRELRKPKNSRRLRPFFDDIRSRGMHGTGAERFRQSWTSATERVAIQMAEK